MVDPQTAGLLQLIANSGNVFGYTVAQTVEHILRNAGDEPVRTC